MILLGLDLRFWLLIRPVYSQLGHLVTWSLEAILRGDGYGTRIRMSGTIQISIHTGYSPDFPKLEALVML